MHTFAVYRMEIQPHAGQTPHETLDEVCTHLSTHVVKFYRSFDKEVFPLHYDGRPDNFEGGRLLARRETAGQFVLATLDWQLPLPDDLCHLWQISCVCAADHHRVEWQYRAEVGLRSSTLPPAKLQMKQDRRLIMPHDLLHAILARWTATIDNWPVPVAVELLQRNDIEAFVERILLNRRRVLPAIVFTADGRFKVPPPRMQDLQRELLAAAHVAALMDGQAAHRLADLVGQPRACPQGMLRVYYPTFTLQSPPEHHPLFRGEAFNNRIVSAALHQDAMKMCVHRVPGGPLIDAATAAVAAERAKHSDLVPDLMNRVAVAEERAKAAEAQRNRVMADCGEARQLLRSTESLLTDQLRARTEEIKELRAQLGACEEEIARLRAENGIVLEKLRGCEQMLSVRDQEVTVLRAAIEKGSTDTATAADIDLEVDRAWHENDRNLVELESAGQQIALLQSDLATARKNLDLLAATTKRPVQEELPASAPKSPLPASAFDALRHANERCGDMLDIWDDAWSSAEQSNFAGPSRILEALQAIAEVGRQYFAALHSGQSIGPLEQLFRDRVPFKYAPGEGEMTMAMYGNERVFQCRGRKREIQRHLTLGGGRNCIQIYFDFDETSQKAIIAYCGRHLRQYRQST